MENKPQIPAGIHVETILNAPIDKVWQAWTDAGAMTWSRVAPYPTSASEMTKNSYH